MAQQSLEALTTCLSVAENWSTPNPRGDFLFLDPTSGQQLDTTKPPSYVAADPVFQEGIACLQERAAGLTVKLALGRHLHAEDLGDMQESAYERYVSEADFYGYERWNHSRRIAESEKRLIQQVIKTARLRGETLSRDFFMRHQDKIPIRGFSLRRIAAIELAPATVAFCYDVAEDGMVAEQATLQAEKALKDCADEGAAARAFVGIQNAREWLAAGKTGLCLGRHPKKEALTKVFLTAGFLHKDIARKFGLCGVQASAFYISADPSDNPMKQYIDEEYVSIMEDGVALAYDMRQLVQAWREIRAGIV